ncbi:ABC transporter permease [Halopiger goleimassiliensis]|uniref:ABC transporter permease n=1 Tax=Halopiger goleimassiliensis TaxID=1293048 RepID=UPI000678045A|nr:ABC transporter permease subunit [Halopiger goleimassiliensis]
MTRSAVVRKDFRDSLRSRTLWVLIVAFALLLSLTAYASQLGEGATVTEFVDLTAETFGLLVPLVGIVLGYKSIVDERESGTIALALSVPTSRWAFVSGKFLGRSLVLALPVLIGMVVTVGVVIVLYDQVPLGRYLLFAALNVLYGLAFLSIALALSTSLATGRRVTTGAFGAYVLLVMFWSELVDLTVLVLWRFDFAILANRPDWSWLLELASPAESYDRLVTALFDSDRGAAYAVADAPWYVDWWVAVVLLVGWVVLPLVVGYARFRRAEL